MIKAVQSPLHSTQCFQNLSRFLEWKQGKGNRTTCGAGGACGATFWILKPPAWEIRIRGGSWCMMLFCVPPFWIFLFFGRAKLLPSSRCEFPLKNFFSPAIKNGVRRWINYFAFQTWTIKLVFEESSCHESIPIFELVIFSDFFSGETSINVLWDIYGEKL